MRRAVRVLAFIVAGGCAGGAVLGDDLRFRMVEGTNGVPLNVVFAGDPAKPAIVFVHGIGQSYLSWEPQLESVLAKDFHLVAFDLRGHGNSGKPWAAEAYTSSRTWAEDVDRILRAARVERPVLVGWSYGTLVVVDYLRHFGANELSGVVLTGAYGGLTPPPKPPSDPALAEQMQRAVEMRTSPDIERNYAAVQATARMLTAKDMGAEWYARAAAIGLLLPNQARKHMFDRPFASMDVIPKITVPLLLVVGGKDRSTPEPEARELASKVRGSSMSVYPESGHAPFAEEPERFNRELADFVRGATNRASQ
jgi:pimeloyl-ACP methyl ester carboxylesterase